ncbi:hypothetical protein FQN53_006535 [Emmonsiellopsis sp. PD_33]|nr:hypothetical protein FQN53_006535 [Emmonsiellopsis sp. PD_33]
MGAHIPAWKKLGLQLKNAPAAPIQEDSETTPSASADKQSPSKATKKRALPSENEEPQGKKQRLENGTAEDKKKSKKTTQKDLKSTELKPSTEQQSAEKDLPSAKKSKKQKRKSVSFADDTKSEDDTADLQPSPEEIEIDLTPAAIAARRAEKKSKRENRAKNRPASAAAAAAQQPSSDPSTTTTHTHPVLRYLSTYHKSREQWKFQKNRETHLLKHALAVDRIPSTYNAALAAYLAGIKSEGAKKRIAEVALEAVKADEGDVESDKYAGDEVARDEYTNAVASFRKRLVGEEVDLDAWEEDWGDDMANLSPEWLKKLEKRRRAELVLHFVGGSGLLLAEKAKEQPKAAASKKRKNRTAVIEDTSSSDSSSSSESDSDSDSDDSGSKPTIKGQVNGKKTTASSSSDDTSSSGSSSESSSDSDSDSDTSSASSSASDSDSSSDSDSD